MSRYFIRTDLANLSRDVEKRGLCSSERNFEPNEFNYFERLTILKDALPNWCDFLREIRVSDIIKTLKLYVAFCPNRHFIKLLVSTVTII